MGNLNQWLKKNSEEAKEGYQVNQLSEKSIRALGIEPVSLDDQIGVAVSYDIFHPLDDVVQVLVEADPMEVAPDSYISFTETPKGDIDCFMSKECDQYAAIHEATNSLPLGIEITTVTKNQYRWVELESGFSMVQRSWLLEKPVANIDWAEVLAQFYFAAIFSTDKGSIRIASGWSVLKLGDVPREKRPVLSLPRISQMMTSEISSSSINTV